MKTTNLPRPGAYRHFKGDYYLLLNILHDASNYGEYVCQYLNILHPEVGYYARPLSEWFSDVSKRTDNLTGQSTRFERVSSFDSLDSCTVTEIIANLVSRPDSPLSAADVEGYNQTVCYADYVVGREMLDPHGVYIAKVFDTYEEALENFGNKSLDVYKRTYIKMT